MIEDVKLKEWYQSNKENERNGLAKILDVEYAHIKLREEDDLYITAEGLAFIDNLMPENFWTDKEWVRENSERLSGTSTVYKIRTKKVGGKQIELVVKWNRMGQDVPGAEDCEDLMSAEFNSPFEEFSLVFELRKIVHDSMENIFIQRPLAIFVPSESVELWQSGRKEYKMRNKIESHKDIMLDMFRSYAVIYLWVPGIDLTQALKKDSLKEKDLKLLTRDAQKKMFENGYVVKDHKPQHVIVNSGKEGGLKRNANGEIEYALVDFELLQRTFEKEEMVKKNKRTDYLKRQKDRFNIETPKKFYPYLNHVSIFDVAYIFGHVESTKGRLWVLGKDPCLFDYFLPERWEQRPRTKISVLNAMYYTISKDNIHLVWKVSKVGSRPDMDPFKEDEKKILDYGYNSPFEEAAIALELEQKGIPTISPRAIYMTSNEIDMSAHLQDNSRYDNHKNLFDPDGAAILRKDRDYISIWGYWRGPIEKLAQRDEDYHEGMNILKAYRERIINEQQYLNLLQTAKQRLLHAGFEDLNLRGNHLMISFDSHNNLIMDDSGLPEIRICNFEFLKRI